MRIFVNGKEREIPTKTTIDLFLREIGVPPERTGTAVARNDEVVPRNRWSETLLADGDRIEIITAVQGG
jgi:sulfur carrier protein